MSSIDLLEASLNRNRYVLEGTVFCIKDHVIEQVLLKRHSNGTILKVIGINVPSSIEKDSEF